MCATIKHQSGQLSKLWADTSSLQVRGAAADGSLSRGVAEVSRLRLEGLAMGTGAGGAGAGLKRSFSTGSLLDGASGGPPLGSSPPPRDPCSVSPAGADPWLSWGVGLGPTAAAAAALVRFPSSLPSSGRLPLFSPTVEPPLQSRSYPSRHPRQPSTGGGGARGFEAVDPGAPRPSPGRCGGSPGPGRSAPSPNSVPLPVPKARARPWPQQQQPAADGGSPHGRRASPSRGDAAEWAPLPRSLGGPGGGTGLVASCSSGAGAVAMCGSRSESSLGGTQGLSACSSPERPAPPPPLGASSASRPLTPRPVLGSPSPRAMSAAPAGVDALTSSSISVGSVAALDAGCAAALDEGQTSPLSSRRSLQSRGPSSSAARLSQTCPSSEQEPFVPSSARTSRLRVTIVSGHGLRGDCGGASEEGRSGRRTEPYCICEVPGHGHAKFQTKVAGDSLDPVWNHVSEISQYAVGEPLLFTVLDSSGRPKADDLLGRATLRSAQFLPDGWYGALSLDEAAKGARPTLRVKIDVLDSADGEVASWHNMRLKPAVSASVASPSSSSSSSAAPQQSPGGARTLTLAGSISSPGQRKPKLMVTMVSARGLRNNGGRSNLEPYCICEIPGKANARFQTKAASSSHDPSWNQEHEIPNYVVGDPLLFTVMGMDVWPRADDLFGTATLRSTHFYPEGWYGDLSIHDAGRGARATLKVKVEVVDAPNHQADHKAMLRNRAGQQDAGGGGGGPRGVHGHGRRIVALPSGRVTARQVLPLPSDEFLHERPFYAASTDGDGASSTAGDTGTLVLSEGWSEPGQTWVGDIPREPPLVPRRRAEKVEDVVGVCHADAHRPLVAAAHASPFGAGALQQRVVVTQPQAKAPTHSRRPPTTSTSTSSRAVGVAPTSATASTSSTRKTAATAHHPAEGLHSDDDLDFGDQDPSPSQRSAASRASATSMAPARSPPAALPPAKEPSLSAEPPTRRDSKRQSTTKTVRMAPGPPPAAAATGKAAPPEAAPPEAAPPTPSKSSVSGSSVSSQPTARSSSASPTAEAASASPRASLRRSSRRFSTDAQEPRGPATAESPDAATKAVPAQVDGRRRSSTNIRRSRGARPSLRRRSSAGAKAALTAGAVAAAAGSAGAAVAAAPHPRRPSGEGSGSTVEVEDETTEGEVEGDEEGWYYEEGGEEEELEGDQEIEPSSSEDEEEQDQTRRCTQAASAKEKPTPKVQVKVHSSSEEDSSEEDEEEKTPAAKAAVVHPKASAAATMSSLTPRSSACSSSVTTDQEDDEEEDGEKEKKEDEAIQKMLDSNDSVSGCSSNAGETSEASPSHSLRMTTKSTAKTSIKSKE